MVFITKNGHTCRTADYEKNEHLLKREGWRLATGEEIIERVKHLAGLHNADRVALAELAAEQLSEEDMAKLVGQVSWIEKVKPRKRRKK